jgi:hypothetical protein
MVVNPSLLILINLLWQLYTRGGGEYDSSEEGLTAGDDSSAESLTIGDDSLAEDIADGDDFWWGGGGL